MKQFKSPLPHRVGKGPGVGAVLAATLLLAFSLALPAKAQEYVLLGQNRIMVWDASGIYGEVPLQGKVDSYHLVRARPLLVVHIPKQGILAVIDVRPYSPSRFRTLAVYQSPSLCYARTAMFELEKQIYLSQGPHVLARLDLEELQLELAGLEAVPMPLVPGRIVLGNRTFYIDQGGLFCEMPEAHPPVPYPLALDQAPMDLLRDTRFLYVLTRSATGGGIVLFDPENLEEIVSFPLNEVPNSMVLGENGQVVVLLESGKIGVVDPIQRRWIRRWRPFLPQRPLRLLPA